MMTASEMAKKSHKVQREKNGKDYSKEMQRRSLARFKGKKRVKKLSTVSK
jgi:hypothetical protein